MCIFICAAAAENDLYTNEIVIIRIRTTKVRVRIGAKGGEGNLHELLYVSLPTINATCFHLKCVMTYITIHKYMSLFFSVSLLASLVPSLSSSLYLPLLFLFSPYLSASISHDQPERWLALRQCLLGLS